MLSKLPIEVDNTMGGLFLYESKTLKPITLLFPAGIHWRAACTRRTVVGPQQTAVLATRNWQLKGISLPRRQRKQTGEDSGRNRGLVFAD